MAKKPQADMPGPTDPKATKEAPQGLPTYDPEKQVVLNRQHWERLVHALNSNRTKIYSRHNLAGRLVSLLDLKDYDEAKKYLSQTLARLAGISNAEVRPTEGPELPEGD